MSMRKLIVQESATPSKKDPTFMRKPSVFSSMAAAVIDKTNRSVNLSVSERKQGSIGRFINSRQIQNEASDVYGNQGA